MNFQQGQGRRRIRNCVFIEEDGNDYKPTKSFAEMAMHEEFYSILNELVDFGIGRYKGIISRAMKIRI